MFKIGNSGTLVGLIILCVILLSLVNIMIKKKNKKQLDRIFIITFLLLIFWMFCIILQIIFVNIFNIDPMVFDEFAYISVCFLPVCVFFMSIIFVKTKISFKRIYLLLFVIPVLSLIVLWTNKYHHLFYIKYSTEFGDTIYGPYFHIHSYYTYFLFVASVIILMRYSIKNSGFFSKQAILILTGTLIPIITNILGTYTIIPMSIYVTPITLTVTVICISFAMLKFDLLKATPIALQRIVDKISDSYIILNENNVITDFNKTFITTFNIDKELHLRGKKVDDFFKIINLDLKKDGIIEKIEKTKNIYKTEVFELYLKYLNKFFNVEISAIADKNKYLGTVLLFKDITQHIHDLNNLKENQKILMERERLATLGQMIGGVAHNLKTPIMSISGATEGLEDLVNEYKQSIGDKDVTLEDHYDIASEMLNWIYKIRSYDNYMSDVITAVKGQAVNMNKNSNEKFTIEELLSRVDILMKHELKSALVKLNLDIKIDKKEIIKGNINSLVQVVNNLISNSIYAYGPADSISNNIELVESRIIDLIIYRNDDNIIIIVKDYGCGMSEEVKNKLFKQMITTKGHNGSGLGLFMSYSTIKGNFQGDMEFISKVR